MIAIISGGLLGIGVSIVLLGVLYLWSEWRDWRRHQRAMAEIRRQIAEIQRARRELARLELLQPYRTLNRANIRAEQLLLSHLTPEQRQEWERKREFDVIVGRPPIARRFRFTSVAVYECSLSGQTLAYYCIQPLDYAAPLADGVLARKLLLEVYPARFFEIANKTSL